MTVIPQTLCSPYSVPNKFVFQTRDGFKEKEMQIYQNISCKTERCTCWVSNNALSKCFKQWHNHSAYCM